MNELHVSVVTGGDPLRLPLFAPDPHPVGPGRRRSDFSLGGPAPHLVALPPVTPIVPSTDDGQDWELVSRLRRAASQRLGDALGRQGHLDRDEQHRLGRSIIAVSYTHLTLPTSDLV